MTNIFSEKYGPWAVIAGASKGLGLEFAKQLAGLGLNVVMVAESLPDLETARKSINTNVECKILEADLLSPDAATRIGQFTQSLEVGLLVFNATHRDLGPFLKNSVEDHLGVVGVNCAQTVNLCHMFAKRMAQPIRTKKGGIILMGSLSGFTGTPYVATYAASKAFNISLGEGIGEELAESGIDVLVCAPGAVATPNYLESIPAGVSSSAPLLQPEFVVKTALRNLGKKRLILPGWKNRLIALLLTRLLPRKLSVKIMGSATKKLYD